jgi:putative transposase
MIPGLPYHITQRGNGRQGVFSSTADYRLYLDLLRSNAKRSSLDLWGYCLMPNHVHLIAVPHDPRAMARALGRTHADYARHFNLQRRSSGHVWQARYFSCPMEESHRWRALAYVERNPVRAGLAEQAGAYQWSSAAAHLTGRDTQGLLDLGPWRKQYEPARWAEVLRVGVDEELLGERLHEATRSGRPLGGDGFVAGLEQQSGRTLRRQPPGRPGKGEAQAGGIGV